MALRCTATVVCLVLSAVVSLACGRRLSLNPLWQPPNTIFTRGDAENELSTSLGQVPAAASNRTIMQCLGARTVTRACHFENIYYEIKSRNFVYFGPDGATSKAFGESHEAGEPWLKLIRGITRWREAEEKPNQFYMEWRSGKPLPAAAEVVPCQHPLHLRSPYHPKSIGHLLRDNLQYLIDLPLRFGRDPGDFDWVRWPTKMAWSEWEEETDTALHYRGLYNNRPSLLWQTVLDKALASSSSGVKYILFREIIAGTGPADVATHMGELGKEPSPHQLSAWAHICHPFPFAEMRDVAYRNFNMQVAAAPDLEPFVLFMDGQRHERRHLVNAGQLIPRLQQTFPGVRMKHVEISVFPLEEQLTLLSKATVVVTNIGSRSFRLIYLPNGATTILVGPPEFEVELDPAPGILGGTDHVTHARVNIPFQEIEWCWGYIGYVNMLQYHVEGPEEVYKKQPWTSWKSARNSDILLNEGKLTALLRIALLRAGSGRAHHGTGTLAAYASG